MNIGEPDEVILPAVGGTVGVLCSALKYGTFVKRVVITSSSAAITQDFLLHAVLRSDDPMVSSFIFLFLVATLDLTISN